MRWFSQSLSSIRTDVPRPVQTLQLGGLLNAFGTGLVFPFLIIYLHNVRGITLGLAGLIVGTNSAVALVTGPAWGPLVDRFGPREVLRLALVFLALGFASFAFVHSAWQGFVAAAIAGLGNGGFWPAQSTLLAGLTERWQRPSVFAVQRITMNLGIGMGGVVGGLIATTTHPGSFQILFAADAITFALFGIVLSWVPRVTAAHREHGPSGGFADVLRHRSFMVVIGLNLVLITAGLSQIDVLPAYMKNFAGVNELGISLVFAANTILIVLAQLPVARSQRGRRRMRTLAAVGVFWGVAWLFVPVVGLSSAHVATAGFIVLAAILGVGECLHGTVQAPLVTDLADERLMGRYMAASAFSWSAGWAIGPAIGGFMLGESATALWVGAGLVCFAAGASTVLLERLIPDHVRRTPSVVSAGE